MCGFRYLYNGGDGYIVRCKNCGHYQIAFASFMLTLSQNEFQSFCELAKYKCSEPDHSLAEHSKSIILQIPAQGVFILLTKNEGAGCVKYIILSVHIKKVAAFFIKTTT